ncbi:2-polyprenyl-6-methoxyphenol hydroxylase-like FAD-dependent oxidoreductase [Mycolicibacterium sp. BK556]|uniref:FAD-dependent monooxygenase n=1 Tax=Mycobacteriaceae TaxID=1762 RepID=UPI00105F4DF8|nr:MULTISPECIES: FAD-dependent monooxygenase [Mycobacteriaceae]MBB3602375.1 2-polyprenyl-6-methoxyphenol hydroxylase-like FAD-dependent oxidoreductase [Mycolicibacterium sp. BK556]MBB3632127.1 2-polyprenyl-6-methoxyphenol hydroxylase-like FAD-dependent oxidoreductase [Mycolicibacterium sp. BK607]TDO18583.1 2-polyprenyl-6-methoxyphenol hydroxylase-like FAD-dependent oxidoreductase [Mycobacterium sp. BK086]
MNQVVISGAGPNGLMLACELALAGVTPVVLDALPGPSDEPKANGLVGQVVRLLDMRGLYTRFSGLANPPQPAAGWIFSGMALDFAGMDDNPMYAMAISQPKLVRFLDERVRELGVEVRWGHELTGLDASGDDVRLTIANESGVYTETASYLVGADGGRSFVRKSVGIDFPGATSPTVARLAHVVVPDEYRRADGGLDVPGFGRVSFGHNRFDRGMVIYAPFEADRSLLGTMEYGASTGDEEPMSLDELRDSLTRVLGTELRVDEPQGPGPHALRRINGQNTRQAERYRSGRVLLVGDAAHVHSAMGGPGLNLGMQDVFNVGWKLAAVINGTAPDALLDTYQTERYPVGERVMMHSMSQIALMAPGPEIAELRKLFTELLTIPQVTAQMAALLAGSDVRYDVGDDHPLSGYLVPDLTLDDGRRVASLLHTARPVLLDLCGGAAANVAREYTDRVDVIEAQLTNGPAALLIRPDGYVAWATDEFEQTDTGNLRSALTRWFS